MGTITQEFDSVRFLEKETNDDGSVVYRDNGVPHRHDGPAMISSDGTKMWFRHGERHREDGPAIEYPDGSRHWYQNNVLHRDLPKAAIEESDGTKHYYKNGSLIATDEKTAYQLYNQQRVQKYIDGRVTFKKPSTPIGFERERTIER